MYLVLKKSTRSMPKIPCEKHLVTAEELLRTQSSTPVTPVPEGVSVCMKGPEKIIP